MMALDTRLCAPESLQTLVLQQDQLIRGNRDAQMFPGGTLELPVPQGCERYKNHRGIYHFRNMSVEMVEMLSKQGRENEILLLGPFSKYDIAVRVQNGEALTYITEYIGGIELRCAIGTDGTIDQQHKYFENTKDPAGMIVIGEYPIRVKRWLEPRKVASHAV
jgi:hypothetical protein